MGAKYDTPLVPDRKPLQELLPLNKPLGLCIDACDVCNFKCDFCFQKYRNIEGKVLSKELFAKIVDDMKEFDEPFKTVHLYNFGEPLINGDIAAFVKMLKENGVAEITQITTNGSLLTQQMSKELIEAGLDRITFSIYGLSDAEYQKFSSAQVSFSKLLDNISYFYGIKGECKVHVKIAGDYFNEEQYEEFLNIFKNITDTYYIDNAVNFWPDLVTVKHTENKHIYGMLNNEKNKICPQPFYQMVIHSDGIVSPCCVDYDKKIIVGDINKESLKEIWSGKEYQRLRKKILQGDLKDELRCKNCQFPSCGASADITPYKKILLKKYGWQEENQQNA